MINAGLICFLLIVVCSLIHYEALSAMKTFLGRITFVPRRAKILVVILGAMCSHLMQILVFATAYHFLRDKFGLGSFGGNFQDSFSGFLYFSTETYTSLGFGDIYPLGALRMLTGVEALIGLVMIGWTASFTYLEMTRYWKDS